MDKKRIPVTEAEVTIKIQVENIDDFYKKLPKGTIQFSIATKANVIKVGVKDLGKRLVTITGDEL